MNSSKLKNHLNFIQSCEQLKNTLRTAYTSKGRQESTAEHTWRLCLMAMLLEPELGEIDFSKLLKICIIHDLGEAIHGDIPAINQQGSQPKADQERLDLKKLLEPLEQIQQAYFLSLWDEYNQASSLEAKLVKGLDKLETLIQHNQGISDKIDYEFNLSYGQQYTDNHPLFVELRNLIDQETAIHAKQKVVEQ